jgi:hypothetical protein
VVYYARWQSCHRLDEQIIFRVKHPAVLTLPVPLDLLDEPHVVPKGRLPGPPSLKQLLHLNVEALLDTMILALPGNLQGAPVPVDEKIERIVRLASGAQGVPVVLGLSPVVQYVHVGPVLQESQNDVPVPSLRRKHQRGTRLYGLAVDVGPDPAEKVNDTVVPPLA